MVFIFIAKKYFYPLSNKQSNSEQKNRKLSVPYLGRETIDFFEILSEGINSWPQFYESGYILVTISSYGSFKYHLTIWFFGAVERSRTSDLLITNQLLYQLSYNSQDENKRDIIVVRDIAGKW